MHTPAYRDVRVLVTGDSPVMRTAIGRLLAAELGVVVAAECANESGALAAAMKCQPGVVVMDLDLGEHERVTQLLAETNGRPVVILTADEDRHAVAAALRCGAMGIVLKERPAEVLLRAIRAVMAGEAWIEPSLLAHIFSAAAPREKASLAARLTRREREIVELVSLGLKNKKIGERLFISETTVRHHLTSIFNKLDVTSRLELMRYTYSGRVASSSRDEHHP